MKILAVEFSTDQRSVAVLDAGVVLGSAEETATRSTPAIAMITRALAQARLERECVECLALGLGPGSYTGIRTAISLAQGWQLAMGESKLKLLGVSSLDCLAAESQARGWLGTIHCVVDAQRQEVYLASYEIGPKEIKLKLPLRLAPVSEVVYLESEGEVIVGPEVNRWVSAGRQLVPTAATLGKLAAQRKDYLAGERLEPIYLRETTFVKAPSPRHIP